MSLCDWTHRRAWPPCCWPCPWCARCPWPPAPGAASRQRPRRARTRSRPPRPGSPGRWTTSPSGRSETEWWRDEREVVSPVAAPPRLYLATLRLELRLNRRPQPSAGPARPGESRSHEPESSRTVHRSQPPPRPAPHHLECAIHLQDDISRQFMNLFFFEKLFLSLRKPLSNWSKPKMYSWIHIFFLERRWEKRVDDGQNSWYFI